MTIDIDAMQTLVLAIVVLFIGAYINSKVSFLRNYNIPEPVVGGLLFALITAVLYSAFSVSISFDMGLRGPLMLAFFTTVGLIASFKLLISGGPRVLLFLSERGGVPLRELRGMLLKLPDGLAAGGGRRHNGRHDPLWPENL